MELKHVLIILYVVICVFWVANYLNRPLNRGKKERS